MIDGKYTNGVGGGGAAEPQTQSQQQSQQQQQQPAPPPRKDHYSYSYTYKTAGDPESGAPGVNTVEVNESVTEEIGPDGSKIIRRHQQEKQINKITQVVTQRVIKRQYIDPNTGQIIEYDPNNELFANLPPETVFEEHTIISDDSSGNPPIVTTTTMSKTAPQSTSNKNLIIDHQMANLNLNAKNIDYTDNANNIYNLIKQQQQQPMAASFRIKSHPEDNQGYPEEKNMDYDPDDSYPDDDSPYEGLIHPPKSIGDEEDSFLKSSKSKRKTRKDIDVNINNLEIVANSAGSSSGSSSSPNLFDSNNDNINMPFVSNVYQKTISSYEESTRQHHHHHRNAPLADHQGTYASILPSSNLPNNNASSSKLNGGSGNYSQSSYYHTINNKYVHGQSPASSNQLSVDPYVTHHQAMQYQQHQPHSQRSQQSYHKHLVNQQQQQASPSLNQNDYDNPQFGVIGNSSSSPLSVGVSSDSSSATASIRANNKHSIYIIDNQASIIIHNHHFDASQFKKSSGSSNQSMTSIKRPTTGGISQNPSQVRFDDTVTRYSDSNVGAVYENNSTFCTPNNYAPVQRLYSAHTDSGQFTDVTSRDSSVNYAKSTSNFGHFSSANLDQTRSSSSSFVYNRPNSTSKYVTLNNESSTLPNANRAYLIYNNQNNHTLNNQASSKCFNLSNRSSSSIDSGIYPTPYLETNGVLVGGWRDPTLPEVIEYLSHSSNEIKANAAAYLQHLVYQDDGKKAETRLLGGIGKLVNLLNSDLLDVHRNACGALRNLSYGKTNDENKLEIRDRGGIPALIRLLKRTQDETVKETITAVLWNLSSCEQIKEQILSEGLGALVKCIIVPYSALEVLNNPHTMNNNYRASLASLNAQQNQLKTSQRLLSTDYSNYPTVLTNASGVLRNCSSNLQFSNCYEARRKLRESEGLIESLLRIIDHAVRPYVNENHYRQQNQSQFVNLDLVIKDNMNSKCVENCMCILRNLSFRLQEIVDPNYDREVRPMPYDEKTTKCVGSGGGGGSSSKKRKNLEDEFLQSVYPYNMPVPNEGKAQELLWSLDTLNKYLIIIKESTVRDTIEAAVGCLQNLTACYWRPSVVIRQEIRKQKGLPTLVHLLKSEEYEDEPVVSVTAIALRNLAIDAKNRELIGKYAMKDLVAKLPDPNKPLPVRLSVLNEDTITAALACINECIKSSDEFVKSCYNEGGVKRMTFITRNGQHFQIKIVKYAAHVLASMWKHKNLHDLLKKDGYKETDFTSVAKQMGLKSQSSSPANTLHRPRGDVNVKPSQHAPSQKSKNKGAGKNVQTNGKSQPGKLMNGSSYPTNNVTQPMQMNEMPIYSQVQKPVNSNKNLIITNGTTNADSWV